MSKGNTWQKQKMAKAKAQGMRASQGGWSRHSHGSLETARLDDARNGGSKAVHTPDPVSMGPFNAPHGLVVEYAVAAPARGLSRDIGRVGKGGRKFEKATRKQRETFSQRNMSGIITSCFTQVPPSKKWEIVKK